MNEQEYANIAAACDRLLRAPGLSLARLAIPVLHVVNEHPGSLAQYAPLLTGQAENPFDHTPRTALRVARGLARALTSPGRHPGFQSPIDVVIVSHLSNPAQLDQENDFYFGALQTLLQERGVSSLLVLIDHLPTPLRAQPTSTFPLPRMLLPRVIGAAREASVWRQCLSASRRLRHEAQIAQSAIGRGVAMLASRHALSASTAINLRMHASLCDILQALNPKIVMTTYEGEGAERLIWHAARTARRLPVCVGYQHARLLKRAHAIRRPVGAVGIECDPDVVLTLGEIPHATLAASAELGAVRFIEYGSHRRSPPVDLPPTQHRPRQCLVLPDADDLECIALFEFALACARQRPDIRFALRPHPIVDTRSLMRRHQTLQQLPGNVSLSVDKPLAQEFAQARYCLYRGSSAAMHAVLAGIKPFYLARPGELPCDTLFELTDWREIVTSPQDLTTRMSIADQSRDSAAARRASGICERYVSPIRSGAIDELLEVVPR